MQRRPSITARSVALAVLTRVESGNAYANILLAEQLANSPLDARDRGLCTELVYGTLQQMRLLDAWLQTCLQRSLQSLDSNVRWILRMTAYQLLHLDRIPDYAAIHAAVEMCKILAPRASGFVNGVLRNLMRRGSPRQQLDRLLQNVTDPIERQALSLSLPTWIYAGLSQRYGAEAATRMLEAQNHPVPLSVRVNLLRTNREELLQRLHHQLGEGAAESSPLCEEAVHLRLSQDVRSLDVYGDGWMTLQDEGAMLVVEAVDPQAGERVLDMCAAPGGKTTHMAERMGNQGWIDALDVHLHKVRSIKEAASRLGIDIIHPRLLDARKASNQAPLQEVYDAVLLDAPCSGFGVLRHRPDIRWRRSPADIESLKVLQQELLWNAARFVRPGGRIVYSTCTLWAEENELLVERFLLEHKEFQVVAVPRLERLLAGRHLTQLGYLLSPEWYATDGFYMVRLEKQV